MPELGFIVYLIAISYGMGVLWYTLLGRNYTSWMRMATFPLLGVIIGEAIWGRYLSSSVGTGLVFFNLHIYVVLVSSFIGALADVAVSSGYGWNQRRARRTTFDEVLASGKSGLIRDATIRVAISDYYSWENSEVRRREERETGCAALTYRLVPRAGEFEPATDLSEAQTERFVNQLFDESTRDEVVAERNFTRFVNQQSHTWQERCVELIGELEAYRDSIE